MRETRQSGSEGGGGDSPYPYHVPRFIQAGPAGPLSLADHVDGRVKPGHDGV